MYNTPFTGINYGQTIADMYANFRILPTVPHHLSTVSIPHFTDSQQIATRL